MLESFFPEINTAKFLALALLVAMLLMYALIRGRALAPNWREAVFLFAYVSIIAHYYAFSVKVDDEIEKMLLFGAMFICLLFLIRNVCNCRVALMFIKKVALWFALLFVGVNFAILLVAYSAFVVEGNFMGVVANSNRLGAYCTIICFPIFLDYSHNASGWRRRVCQLFLVLTIAIILFSRSRASLVAVLMASLYLLYKKQNLSSLRKTAAVVTILGLAWIAAFSIGEKYKGAEMFSTREKLFSLRLDAISQKPLSGWGFRSSEFSEYDDFHKFNPQEKGNTILAMVEEFGFVLGSILIFLLTALWFRGLRLFGGTLAGEAFVLVLLTSCIHLMFETWLFNLYGLLSIYVWSILFLSLSLKSRKGKI